MRSCVTRCVPRFLADKDALGVAAHALEHSSAHQAVVQHHVALLQQLQRAQRQQIRIARPGADQVNLAAQPLRAVSGRAQFGIQQRRLGDRRRTGLLAILPANRAGPRNAAALDIGQRALDALARRPCQARQLPEPLGQHRLELGAHPPRQRRRLARAADRDHQRRTIDDGRHDGRRGARHRPRR